jgi:hypothetical protein
VESLTRARCMIHAHEHLYTKTLPHKQAQHLLVHPVSLSLNPWLPHLLEFHGFPTLATLLQTLDAFAPDYASVLHYAAPCVQHERSFKLRARSTAHSLLQYRKALTMDHAAPDY